MRRLYLYPLIMKGSFLYLHRTARFGATLRCTESWETKIQYKLEWGSTSKMWGEKKNNSTQYSHFLLLGRPPINIYLISNALPHSFLSSCIGFVFFGGGGSALMQEFQRLSTLLRNSTESSYKQTKILERGGCEFDKTQGAGFSVTRIMLESATEIWNLYVQSVSEGWITHLSWVWELQW